MKINIDQNIVNKLFEILNPIAIYLCGSSLLVDNPNDIDLSIVYENYNEMRTIICNMSSEDRNYFNNLKKEQHITCLNSSLDIIYDRIESFAYEGPNYYIFLKGTDVLDKSKINILENKSFRINSINKLLTSIDEWLSGMIKNVDDSLNIYGNKPYRILWTTYILYNNSYTLTEKQIEKLNEVHDAHSMSNDLYIWCKEICLSKLIEDTKVEK